MSTFKGREAERADLARIISQHAAEAWTSGADMARDLHISRQTAYDILAGRKLPTLPLAIRIGIALDLTLDELVTPPEMA